ncbi:Gaa1-like GPI transamidase component [Pisolithus orientalis]|uniref:Gaa1-like GPI transamidase component n=1 Tax=Pisolithus orientalis TaxID=936130 RepID=UPI002224B573|nr:Gaa1-like GPI transamidase component [Pisolithus orientalis]KAI6028674.1 Gaa1-like GPI transamidase component [Pisolithus orientalis]
MSLIPISPLSQPTYIDENALQPAQVNTYWNWQDVHRADQYLYHLEGLRDRNAASEQRAQFIRDEFANLGFRAATQNYTFTTSSGPVSGVNAYAIMASPRTPSSEAMVISATWRSEVGAEPFNLRGISIVLALAAFLKNYSLWAKDIIFVIGDGHVDGMQAWLNAYHGTVPPNLETGLLEYTSGVIWTALNIDYSGHSFSHLGVFFEGLNGRLPNQDLINSVRLISHYTAGVPFVVYDHLEPSEFPDRWQATSILASAPDFIRRSPQLQDFEYRAKNIARHIDYQARGKPSGAHGLYHKFRIDAITLIIESTLRTTNNLLERLHASFFFYLFTSPGTFMKIGKFLPSAVLVSAAMMISGLGDWVNAGWLQDVAAKKEGGGTGAGGPSNTIQSEKTVRWRMRRRPVLRPIFTVLGYACDGLDCFRIDSFAIFCQEPVSSLLLFGVLAVLPFVFTPPSDRTPEVAPFSLLLKSFNLCLASIVISTTSLLNFSLAAMLAITLAIPLMHSYRPRSSSLPIVVLAKYVAYSFLAWGWLVFLPNEVRQAVWNWEVLGIWFAPFICVVYGPLVTQAGITSLQS